jgi:phage shock protein C
MKRSYNDRWLAGVCGGIAEALDVEAIYIRGIVLILFLVGHLITACIYLLAWMMLDEGP